MQHRNMTQAYWGEAAPAMQSTPPTSEIVVGRPSICERVANRIYFYSDITSRSVLELAKEIRMCANDLVSRGVIENLKDNDQRIYLNIQSYGGSVFAGLAAMDKICASRIPITTIVDGCCASTATFLSIAGAQRQIHKHAFMLIHQLSSCFWGKYAEFQDERKNLDKIMKIIQEIYGERTRIPPETLQEILQHDLWLSADECLSFGMVDTII